MTASPNQLCFGATYISGVAPGTALGTTAALCLYNPPTNVSPIQILKVSAAYFSGTLGAGALLHCLNPTTNQTAPSGGNAVTGLCLKAGSTAVAVGVARFGATVVQPTAFRPFCSMGAILASSVEPLAMVVDDLSGENVSIEPGASYQVQAIAAAGSTPLLLIGVVWRE